MRGALVLAWTQARPGEQVSSRRKAAHVGADFRQDRRCRQNLDSRDRAEEAGQGSKVGLAGLHLLVHPGNRRIDRFIDPGDRRRRRVVLLQIQLQQEAMVVGHPAVQACPCEGGGHRTAPWAKP